MSSMGDHRIRYPKGFGMGDLLGAGISGFVVRLDAVLKFPSVSGPSHLDREARVFPNHDCFLTYYGRLGDALILQHASRGPIRASFVNERKPVVLERRLRWATQLASALHFAHEKKVMHGDISCNNAFLDRHWNVKLADFARSAIDDETALTLYETSHARLDQEDASIEEDIYALDFTFYEVMTDVKSYKDLEDHQLEKVFSQGHFPDLTSLPALETVIARC